MAMAGPPPGSLWRETQPRAGDRYLAKDRRSCGLAVRYTEVVLTPEGRPDCMVMTFSPTSWREENLPVAGEARERSLPSARSGMTWCIYTSGLPYVKGISVRDV